MRQETLQFQTIIPSPSPTSTNVVEPLFVVEEKPILFFCFFFFLQKFLFIFKTPFFSESRSNPFQKLEVRFSHSHKLNIALPLFIC